VEDGFITFVRTRCGERIACAQGAALRVVKVLNAGAP